MFLISISLLAPDYANTDLKLDQAGMVIHFTEQGLIKHVESVLPALLPKLLEQTKPELAQIQAQVNTPYTPSVVTNSDWNIAYGASGLLTFTQSGTQNFTYSSATDANQWIAITGQLTMQVQYHIDGWELKDFYFMTEATDAINSAALDLAAAIVETISDETLLPDPMAFGIDRGYPSTDGVLLGSDVNTQYYLDRRVIQIKISSSQSTPYRLSYYIVNQVCNLQLGGTACDATYELLSAATKEFVNRKLVQGFIHVSPALKLHGLDCIPGSATYAQVHNMGLNFTNSARTVLWRPSIEHAGVAPLTTLSLGWKEALNFVGEAGCDIDPVCSTDLVNINAMRMTLGYEFPGIPDDCYAVEFAPDWVAFGCGEMEQ